MQYKVIGSLALLLIFLCDFVCEQGSGPGGDHRGLCSFDDHDLWGLARIRKDKHTYRRTHIFPLLYRTSIPFGPLWGHCLKSLYDTSALHTVVKRRIETPCSHWDIGELDDSGKRRMLLTTHALTLCWSSSSALETLGSSTQDSRL